MDDASGGRLIVVTGVATRVVSHGQGRSSGGNLRRVIAVRAWGLDCRGELRRVARRREQMSAGLAHRTLPSYAGAPTGDINDSSERAPAGANAGQCQALAHARMRAPPGMRTYVNARKGPRNGHMHCAVLSRKATRDPHGGTGDGGHHGTTATSAQQPPGPAASDSHSRFPTCLCSSSQPASQHTQFSDIAASTTSPAPAQAQSDEPSCPPAPLSCPLRSSQGRDKHAPPPISCPPHTDLRPRVVILSQLHPRCMPPFFPPT